MPMPFHRSRAWSHCLLDKKRVTIAHALATTIATPGSVLPFPTVAQGERKLHP